MGELGKSTRGGMEERESTEGLESHVAPAAQLLHQPHPGVRHAALEKQDKGPTHRTGPQPSQESSPGVGFAERLLLFSRTGHR